MIASVQDCHRFVVPKGVNMPSQPQSDQEQNRTIRPANPRQTPTDHPPHPVAESGEIIDWPAKTDDTTPPKSSYSREIA
jgi:hypothetical protein